MDELTIIKDVVLIFKNNAGQATSSLVALS